ncbi:MAG: hypothetical protein Q8O93_02290 [bacterium]|nr:hypothetical protein [bacterium]
MSIFTWNRQEGSEAVLFSNVNLSEPFVARIWGLLDILKLTKYQNQNQKQINDAILYTLTDCLLPAHISLTNIKKHSTSGETPYLDKQKDYLDLYNHLWSAYKDRMPQVFNNSHFDIGFLFQNDKNFEQGLKKLKCNFPILGDDFLNSLVEYRNTWQKDMAMIRNDYIQHKKIDPDIAGTFFTPEKSNIIFTNIWRTIESIVFNFLALEFPFDSFIIVEIPKEKRDPKMPKKYNIIPAGVLQG